MEPSMGVVEAGNGLHGETWNILDQIYIPKHVSNHSFSWHATLPADSFVPLHVHPTQDEFIFMLDGRLEFVLNDERIKAGPGDLVSLPLGVPHSIHNVSEARFDAYFGSRPLACCMTTFEK